MKHEPTTRPFVIIPGDFGLRFFAALIDLTLLSILIFLLKLVLPEFSNFWFFEKVSHDPFEGYTHWVMKRSSLIVLWCLYSIFMDCSQLQGTVGKQWMGLMVTDEVGKRISFKKSLVRNLLKIVSYIALGLGFIYALFDKKKRGWHDLLAGSMVLKNYR